MPDRRDELPPSLFKLEVWQLFDSYSLFVHALRLLPNPFRPLLVLKDSPLCRPPLAPLTNLSPTLSHPFFVFFSRCCCAECFRVVAMSNFVRASKYSKSYPNTEGFPDLLMRLNTTPSISSLILYDIRVPALGCDASGRKKAVFRDSFNPVVAMSVCVPLGHVFVEAPKINESYTGIRQSTAVGEQNYIKGNPLYFAVAVSVSPPSKAVHSLVPITFMKPFPLGGLSTLVVMVDAWKVSVS